MLISHIWDEEASQVHATLHVLVEVEAALQRERLTDQPEALALHFLCIFGCKTAPGSYDVSEKHASLI